MYIEKCWYGSNISRIRIWGSSVSIVFDYRLDGQATAEAKDLSFSLCVQTSSEAHPASYPVGTGGPFWRQNAAGT
jgi:hypothetical protein